jgi:hypothetical protein
MGLGKKIIGATIGASIGYSVTLVIALKYAKESSPVPEIVIIPTIVGGVIGVIIS